MYYNGRGVPVNIPLAAENYKEGASRGFLAAEHAFIHLAFKHGTLSDKILFVPRIGLLLFKAVRMAFRDIDDIRLVDVVTQKAPRA